MNNPGSPQLKSQRKIINSPIRLEIRGGERGEMTCNKRSPAGLKPGILQLHSQRLKPPGWLLLEESDLKCVVEHEYSS